MKLWNRLIFIGTVRKYTLNNTETLVRLLDEKLEKATKKNQRKKESERREEGEKMLMKKTLGIEKE